MRLFLMLFLLVPLEMVSECAMSNQKSPNVVIMVADDLGIGDIGCYGNNTIKTPNIDKLASEGVMLTHHLAPASICTPSRAGLLTARYPARYGLVGEANTPPVVVHVASRVGLPVTEITLAKALASANYTTAAVGKWHLGAMCGLFGTGCNGPQQHGFQEFYGLPFTLTEEFRGDHSFWVFPLKDFFYQALCGTYALSVITLIIAKVKLQYKMMFIFIIGLFITMFFALTWFLYTHFRFHTDRWWQVSMWMDQHLNGILMHNDRVIEQPIVLDGLMQKLVNFSVKFIEDHVHDANPFFLYHSFAHVHTPMFNAPSMVGRSRHGRYGDNVEEMDEGVGTIMETIERLGLDDNTVVYFLSDHGGHLEAVDDKGQRTGGYNGLFKGGKSQGGSEGGIRVPGIYRWKGRIPSGVKIDFPTSLLDTMPTMLELANLPSLQELVHQTPPKELDGLSIAKLLLLQTRPEPRVFIHHCRREVHALRWSQDNHVYKMYLKRHKYSEGSTQCGWGVNTLCSCFGNQILDISQQPLLFDLIKDSYEDRPILNNTTEYQEVVGHLKQYLTIAMICKV